MHFCSIPWNRTAHDRVVTGAGPFLHVRGRCTSGVLIRSLWVGAAYGAAMPIHRAGDLRPRRLYSRRLLREQGMHPRVLASKEISTPLAGYCTRTDAPAPLARVAGLLQKIVVPGAVISHETAAELFGFPLPTELTHAGGAPLHCTTGDGGLPRVRRTVIVHSASSVERVRFRGLSISPPLEVLRQIAPKLSHEDLVACIDALVAKRHGTAAYVPLARLRLGVVKLRGVGAAAVRRAALDARENVWSPMETRTRLLLVGAGFPEPAPNLRVTEQATDKTFFIDLAYPAVKVAVEYDSEEHRLNRNQWLKDLHKNEVLHQLGWQVLRISVADVREPADFLARLAAAGVQRKL